MRCRLLLWGTLLAAFLETGGCLLLIRRLPPTSVFISHIACRRFQYQPPNTILCYNSHEREPHPCHERTVVILYHKPPNVITSHSNTDAVPANNTLKQWCTVYQDIETLKGYRGDLQSISSLKEIGIHSKLHAVGRLDAETTGLLLLTNDGGLVHHMTNPTTASSISKTYEAVIMGYWNETCHEFIDMRQNGVDIGNKYGGQTNPPVALRVLDHPTSKSTRIQITIQEGKNRQVRRMFHAIGSGVMKLHRTCIGDNLTLGDLKQGEWCVLTDNEVKHYMDWTPQLIESRTAAKKRSARGSRRGDTGSGALASRQKRRKR